MITPFDDFFYIINNVIFGESPSCEDFLLLVGTIIAFIAFILWCCFPVQPKENERPPRYDAGDDQFYYMQRKPDCY